MTTPHALPITPAAAPTLGPYRLGRELGRGGMGIVYEGVHQLLEQRVAIKVLLPSLASAPDVLRRFLAEARAASASQHPGIIQIFDLGLADGRAYIAMELLTGESLAARLHRVGRLAVDDALTIVRQIASALAAAHDAGVIHRDLKPDNVFLVPDAEVAQGERAKLLDFGISKSAQPGTGAITATDLVIGTPLYMSPEQCRGGGPPDPRSDLYALGCILFELLAGQPPFTGEIGEVLGAHLHLVPPPLAALVPDVPPEVAALVAALLSKSPARRPASAAALVQQVSALTRAIAPPPPPPPFAIPWRSTHATTLDTSTGEATPHPEATRSASGHDRRAARATRASMVLGVIAGVAVAVGSALLVRWAEASEPDPRLDAVGAASPSCPRGAGRSVATGAP